MGAQNPAPWPDVANGRLPWLGTILEESVAVAFCLTGGSRAFSLILRLGGPRCPLNGWYFQLPPDPVRGLLVILISATM
jgi:hypothetical protein